VPNVAYFVDVKNHAHM